MIRQVLNNMTKVGAIKKVMQDNGGLANWAVIYNEIAQYYPNIKHSRAWQEGVRGVLYREIKHQRSFKKLAEGVFSLLEYDENNLVLAADRINTEDTVLIKIRRGQNQFRQKLMEKLGAKCPITQIDDRRLLVASHIKPWAFSNDCERLDVNNGLMLSAMFDRLFDGGLITFSVERELLVSPLLSKSNIQRLNIQDRQSIILLPTKGREDYLEYHQKKIFLQ